LLQSLAPGSLKIEAIKTTPQNHENVKSMLTPYIGPFAALLAALFWALATLLYARAGSHLNAAQLNLVKGFVAVPLLAITAVLSGDFLSFDGSTAAWLLLASGVIGITIGDTLYFAALRRLGPWHTMLLEYLAPPFAAVLALILLQQGMSWMQVIAALVVIAGVIWVITERKARQSEATVVSRSGLAAGVGASFCQALGLVMAFHALTEFNVSALHAAFVRLGAGTLALTIALLLLKPSIIKTTRAAVRHTSVPWLLLAIFMGTFLAIWLQQLAIASIHPGVAQTLLATAPLWLIPIRMLQGEKMSARAIAGALLALTGITMLFNSL